jgi:hypothetical protein
LVDTIKKDQKELFNGKRYSENDLSISEDVNILDKE